MEAVGINDIVVNIHAFADKVEEWLQSYSEKNPSMTIRVSDERDLLLETGGGLKKMHSILSGEPFLVHNVDVLSDIDLIKLKQADSEFYKTSLQAGSATNLAGDNHIATLAVRKTESDRYFLFNEAGLLCGWENVKTGKKKLSRPKEKNLQRFGFTGIHIIHPELFSLMKEKGIFSITDVYLRLARKYNIHMFDVSECSWFDIGSPEQLTIAEKSFIS
jgi:NDP-sugar pyrophosphorylase family protein